MLDSRRLGRWWEVAKEYLPDANFIVIHYAYFILTSLITAIIFWAISTPFGSVRFIDAFFLTSSAMTEAGLNTINLSTLNTVQQIMLFVLIMMGSAIFVSAFIVLIRKNAFEKKLSVYIAQQREEKRIKRQHSTRSHPLNLPRRFSRAHPADDAEKAQVTAKALRLQTSHQGENGSAGTDHRDSPTSRKTLSPNGVTFEPSREESNSADEAAQTTAQSPTSPSDKRVGFTFDESDEPAPTQFIRSSTFRSINSQGERPKTFLKRALSMKGVGAAEATLDPRQWQQTRSISSQSVPTVHSASSNDKWSRYLTKNGFVSRNSHFHNLTDRERQRLGGCEYRAVLFLAWLVPVYFVIWQLFGAIAIGAWVANHRASVAAENGLNPWWVGSFNAISAFNNSGMSLLDANMTAFGDAVFVLLSMGLFIIAGNTGYPIFLRLAIWTIWKLLPEDEDPNETNSERATLRFLLDHPRRCYTNLFPATHTWWLGLTLIVLNGIDWAAFEILNIGNHKITYLSPGIEVVDGLFQALAVRAGGFYVVPIPNIRISLQVLYVVMMYISAYPVVITMRNSNVYEEKSLGIFPDEAPIDEPPRPDPSIGRFGGLKRRATTLFQAKPPAQEVARSYFVRQQLRAQLAHDAWFIVLAVFFIMIIEGGQFESRPIVFSVFNVLFEVVSGYACVGISLGLPDQAYSFCGAWHTTSKLILIAVMIRGRHRGLPVAIDHAVQLPNERLDLAEENEGNLRSFMARSKTLRLD